jgi:hypothetical protein
MSALGQKQTFAVRKRMSALPLIATVKADISETTGTESGDAAPSPDGSQVDTPSVDLLV